MGVRALALISMLCMVVRLAPAQNFNIQVAFDRTKGSGPRASLVQATDGNFYGTTFTGGSGSGGGCTTGGCGTVFELSPAGALKTVYSFCSQSGCSDGSSPVAGLIQASDGNLYGTTTSGGANGQYGTVFKLTSTGTVATLYSFCTQTNCADGELPNAGLIQAADGNFYGTTTEGGTGSSCTNGCGTIFQITPSGALTTLHSFCVQGYPTCADGFSPYAGLVQGTDGNLYGTTAGGGSTGSGTVFKITLAGALTSLYSFCSQLGCTDGNVPFGGLIQASDGNFYGTTFDGRPPTNHLISSGTVFKITPAGNFTTLYNFCAQTSFCTDGENPNAGLVQGTDGNLYGTTDYGGVTGSTQGSFCGSQGCGTVFKITPTGALTTLHRFCPNDFFPCAGGKNPYASLVQGTDGNFYGTTYLGGTNNSGTVFRLSAICNTATLSVNAALYPAPVPNKTKFFVNLSSGPQPLGVCDALATPPALPGSACTTSYASPAVLGVSCGAASTCNPANDPSMLVTGMGDGLDDGVFQITRFVSPSQIKVKAPSGGVLLQNQTGVATFSTTCPQ